MSAEVLRRAASAIRDDWARDADYWDGRPPRTRQVAAAWVAVADWLDAAYDDERRFAAQGAHGFPGENPALAVARAYLGETS